MALGSARLLLVVTLGLLTACGPEAGKDQLAATMPGAWLAHRNDEGFDQARAEAAVLRLAECGYRWIALGPEPSMADVTRPLISADPHDDDTRLVIRAARLAGLEVMLCPRIESPSFFRAEAPLWRGDIAMTSPEDWDRFHDALEAILLHYARMASEEGVGLLSLGLEYRQSTRAFPERWRQIAAALRQVYSGKLTYSANWYEEYHEVGFWDALDYIGIGAYFPLAEGPRGSALAMQKAWTARMVELSALGQKFDRPVIFTEIGYPGTGAAGHRPWDWSQSADKTIDHRHQADCYRAFFAAAQEMRFPAGFFIWRYESELSHVRDWEYCPAGRPAESVIKEALDR